MQQYLPLRLVLLLTAGSDAAAATTAPQPGARLLA